MSDLCLVGIRVVHYSFPDIFKQVAPLLFLMSLWRYVLGKIIVKSARGRWIKRNNEIPKILSHNEYKVHTSVLQQTYHKQSIDYNVAKVKLRKTKITNHINNHINHTNTNNNNSNCNNNHIYNHNCHNNNHNNNTNHHSNCNSNCNGNFSASTDVNTNANTNSNSSSNRESGIKSPRSGFISEVEKDKELLPMLSQKLNLSTSDIVEYWKYLRKLDKIEKNLLKYNEEVWKCITMTCITIFGIYVMCHEPFFNDPRLLFREYPQPESALILKYYRISLAYHGFRAIDQFFEPKRKDFWAMTVHHWVTVVLIIGSWWTGTMQIGALVMVCHDNADIFLPAAKISRYEKIPILTNIFFALFLLSWILSRIALFSWKVIYPLLFQAYPTFTCNPYYSVFSTLLCILLILHFYWLRLITGVAINAYKSKAVEDNRSDSSDNDM